ncbi:MAG: TonB-dependent receptor [Alistipes sp.]
MKKLLLFVVWLIISSNACFAGGVTYALHGRVIDRFSRQPVDYAAVVLAGQEQQGVATDSLGNFTLGKVQPGIYRLRVSCVGYKTALTSEYIVSAGTPFIEVELEGDAEHLEAVTVRPTPFRRTAESPVSMRVIGLKEIEKSPGANRDVSRIVRSYPGVAFSPVGYRNDLIVRGGGPAENKFYMDGIEIPNINHFATQGATGGPVSIVNADLVREINFYTGAFPADKSGALSSVLDFRLRDGNADKQTFKATLGASEVALSGSGHLTDQTTYLFSVRQSYLQVLFKMLGLPFLPNYIDGQLKIRTRLTAHDELIVLGLAGIDNMKLNTDETGEQAEYLLSYLPRVRQETFTIGAVYRHYAGRHIQSIYLSHNYLNNRNEKYRNNDSSSEDNLTLRLRGVEQKTTLRGENRSYWGRWTVREGLEVSYIDYFNRTFRRRYLPPATDLSASAYSDTRDNHDPATADRYRTHLGLIGWGVYASADYASTDKRFSASAGLRADGCNYSGQMARFWRQLSPRASLSYAFNDAWSVSAAAGFYHQMPPLTALGFGDTQGTLVNKTLDYQRVLSVNAGLDWRLRDRLVVSVEGFYKKYGRIPLSLDDQIPLSCKGNDYGSVGDEALRSSAEGRSFGVEAMARWQIPGRVNLVGSVTLYRSEYRNDARAAYIASAWDNRFIINLSGTLDLPRQWSLGARLSCIGGAPFTPYDVDKSSQIEAWNAQGRPYYDYARYNTGRLSTFTQLDVRVDKTFYFRHCMLGLYIDLQNVTGSELHQPDVLLSTGVADPTARAVQRNLDPDLGNYGRILRSNSKK